MKIYKKGNYIYLINASGDIKQDHANEVKITKTNVANEIYSIYSDDLGINYVTFEELTQENGTAYASVQAWELWYAENTGFNPASGGSGAGTVINTVSNFASLPDPTLASNDFYWVSSATGYRIIGTYKSNGLYYSNGTSWEYIDAPTTATQSEVNDGTLTDKYLTPSTFENASKWTTKMDANVSINALNDVTITNVTNGQILRYNITTSQWENVTVTIGNGDMQKATYDIDNDGIVDYAETIPVTVRNNSATETLRRGTIVYLSGSTGYRPNAYKARANAESTSSGTFGVVISDIAPNSDGLVACLGTLHNLDTRDTAPNPFTTDTLVDGDILWLDPNNAGYVTKTKPQAPNHIVFIGIVARTSPTLGRIVYRISNGFEIDELHNVFINGSLANNDILYYESASLLWKTKQLTKSDVGLANVSNTDTTTTTNITDATDKRFITDAERTSWNSSTPSFIPNLTASAIAGGYYGNNASATFSVLGNVSAAALSGTAAAVTQTNTSVITRTIRIQIPTASTAGSRAGVRTASLRHAVGQGFSFSVGWCIQDAAYVVGSKQFHGLLPISTLGTLNNLVDNSSLINFIGVGSDALDTNLQVFYNDATGTASKIDLGVNFPANRTAGAVLDKFYVFDMYNEHDSMNVKYRITDRVSGNTAQGTISTDLPDATVLLGAQSLRTNGVTALAQVTQWSHLIGYYL
ncbi:hypothetical protein UFOVP598_22 [uncultured Caudovirales phage]|uniref:Uncharacterized protein n=1 Tax=uncultured Caudovirales phage TaxID=2100421 RepID=A0A6J5N039_9CAUD|nr:hypothetical protein UFOVP598_22 [uncultured Caudovirales phage]